jgi:hypothetical protein
VQRLIGKYKFKHKYKCKYLEGVEQGEQGGVSFLQLAEEGMGEQLAGGGPTVRLQHRAQGYLDKYSFWLIYNF